ncbi:MAG: sulfurtransferase [Peptococcaceae bacterium]|nr:sulfurtransferase [Peptococcaceae bacterium]
MNNRQLLLLTYLLTAALIVAVLTATIVSCARSRQAANVLRQAKDNPVIQAAAKISRYQNPGALISIYELKELVGDPNVVLINTLGSSYEVFAATYQVGHIPGAAYILNCEYDYPNYYGRIGTPAVIQEVLRRKGVDNQKRIIIYGHEGAGRFYWMMKMFGSTNQIQVLDGDIETWRAAGFPVDTAAPPSRPTLFTFDLSRANMEYIAGLDQVIDAVVNYTPAITILDIRPHEYYLAAHIPQSINIAMEEVFNKDRTFKSASELQAIFAAKGVTADKTIYIYGQDGFHSPLIWFVLHELLGYSNVKIYDGGIIEWREHPLIIECGEQKQIIKPNS